jgi:hypothetical protein
MAFYPVRISSPPQRQTRSLTFIAQFDISTPHVAYVLLGGFVVLVRLFITYLLFPLTLFSVWHVLTPYPRKSTSWLSLRDKALTASNLALRRRGHLGIRIRNYYRVRVPNALIVISQPNAAHAGLMAATFSTHGNGETTTQRR